MWCQKYWKLYTVGYVPVTITIYIQLAYILVLSITGQKIYTAFECII